MNSLFATAERVFTDTKGGGNEGIIKVADYLIIVAVGILSVTGGYNNSLDYANTLMISLLVLLNLHKDRFYYVFPFLMVFSDQLLLPFGVGSVMRVYTVLLFFKLILDKRHPIRLNTRYVVFGIPLLLIAVYSFFSGSTSSGLSILINFVVIGIIHSKTTKDPVMLKKEFFYFACAIVFTGIFGFLHGRFINQAVQTGSLSYVGYTRFSGTIDDPNYSAMLFNIGIFLLLFTKYRISKWLHLSLIAVLYVFLFMTVSLQGIVGNFVILLIAFFLSNRKGLGNRKKSLLTIVLFLGVIVLFSNSPLITPVTLRLDTRLADLMNHNYAAVTTGRTRLSHEYLDVFESKALIPKLMGGDLIISDGSVTKSYIDQFGNVSHNSYIDMLFQVGFFGTIIVVWGFLRSIFGLLSNHTKSREEVYLSAATLKLVILYTCLGLSIFPYTYFIYIFLI